MPKLIKTVGFIVFLIWNQNLFSQLVSLKISTYFITDAFFKENDTLRSVSLRGYYISQHICNINDSCLFMIFNNSQYDEMIFFSQTVLLDDKLPDFEQNNEAKFYNVEYSVLFTQDYKDSGKMMIEYIKNSYEDWGNKYYFFQIKLSDFGEELQIYAFKIE